MITMEQIWPAVFPETPVTTGKNGFPKTLLDMNIQEMSTKSRKDEDVCESRAFKKWYADCRKGQTMTIYK